MRDYEAEKALAESPANAGEIVESGAGSDEDGAVGWLGFGHFFLGLGEAGFEFVRLDGADFVA